MKPHRHRAAALALVAMLATVAAGCHGEVPKDMPAQDRSPADASYRTRGVVYQLPASPQGELVLFHEAVTEFVDRKGERSGMDSMAMPFAVPEEVSLEGLEKGDKVEIAFEVRWQGAPTLLITELRELPPETELHLGQSAPSEGSPDEADGAVSKGSSEAI